jgi:hypothetical protein
MKERQRERERTRNRFSYRLASKCPERQQVVLQESKELANLDKKRRDFYIRLVEYVGAFMCIKVSKEFLVFDVKR